VIQIPSGKDLVALYPDAEGYFKTVDLLRRCAPPFTAPCYKDSASVSLAIQEVCYPPHPLRIFHAHLYPMVVKWVETFDIKPARGLYGGLSIRKDLAIKHLLLMARLSD